MENSLELIHNCFFMALSTLFLFQSILLFVRSKNNKVRRYMAVLELLWGVAYFLSLIAMNVMNPPEEYSLLRDKPLVIGNYYIVLMLFFMMQVLIPGWLNVKRTLLLLLPILLMTGIYYAGMALLGESPEYLYTYAELFASITHFNVWFRFVILLSDIAYIAMILIWLYGYNQKYIQWKNENYSDQESVDISWMKPYVFIIIGISFFYMGILFIGGRISVLFHCSFVACSFSYLFYKVMFYESPYPENFFDDGIKKEAIIKLVEEVEVSPVLGVEEISEASFTKHLPVYVDTLKTWMDNEKPYLYKDFKLTDVSRILKLNRSYLSRIFNEGYGKKFNEVVRAYRIEYSMEIMRKNPYMPSHKIADLSGFSSECTFLRAFKMIHGVTPFQYRESGRKPKDASAQNEDGVVENPI